MDGTECTFHFVVLATSARRSVKYVSSECFFFEDKPASKHLEMTQTLRHSYSFFKYLTDESSKVTMLLTIYLEGLDLDKYSPYIHTRLEDSH